MNPGKTKRILEIEPLVLPAPLVRPAPEPATAPKPVTVPVPAAPEEVPA